MEHLAETKYHMVCTVRSEVLVKTVSRFVSQLAEEFGTKFNSSDIMRISENHNSLGCKQLQSQDMFWPTRLE